MFARANSCALSLSPLNTYHIMKIMHGVEHHRFTRAHLSPPRRAPQPNRLSTPLSHGSYVPLQIPLHDTPVPHLLKSAQRPHAGKEAEEANQPNDDDERTPPPPLTPTQRNEHTHEHHKPRDREHHLRRSYTAEKEPNNLDSDDNSQRPKKKHNQTQNHPQPPPDHPPPHEPRHHNQLPQQDGPRRLPHPHGDHHKRRPQANLQAQPHRPRRGNIQESPVPEDHRKSKKRAKRKHSHQLKSQLSLTRPQKQQHPISYNTTTQKRGTTTDTKLAKHYGARVTRASPAPSSRGA